MDLEHLFAYDITNPGPKKILTFHNEEKSSAKEENLFSHQVNQIKFILPECLKNFFLLEILFLLLVSRKTILRLLEYQLGFEIFDQVSKVSHEELSEEM